MVLLCSICNDPYFRFTPEEIIHTTRCGHLFHLNCITKWLTISKSCPDCRSTVTESSTIRVYANNAESDLNPILNDKLVAQSRQLEIKLKEQLDRVKELVKNQAVRVKNLEKESKEQKDEITNLEQGMRGRYDQVRSLKKELKERNNQVIELKKELKEWNDRALKFEKELKERNDRSTTFIHQLMELTR